MGSKYGACTKSFANEGSCNAFEGFVFRGMQDSYLPSNFVLMVAASSGSVCVWGGGGDMAHVL